MRYKNLVMFDSLYTEKIDLMSERAFLADDVFALLQSAYQNVKGGLHFASADELVQKTALWKVIYFESTIVGVVIYKAKKGLKMVALAVATEVGRVVQKHTKKMLSYLFKITFNNTWMEVSEGAERFIIKNGGERYFVSNQMASKLTGKEIWGLCDDGYHYKRRINGVLKTKVIVGNPKF
jgi:hypothetical protein